MPGLKMMIFPRRFVMGPGAMKVAGKLTKIYVKKPLIMGGKRALESCRKAGLQAGLEKEGVKYVEAVFGEGVPYGPECCEPEIERLTKIGRDNGCDGVIAAGGGKVIDAGKAVASKLGGEVVIIPTIAATDAPTSALSVIYTTEHVFKEYWFYDFNPAMVLIDSKIIAEAPARWLASGMGDAASKKFEGRACYRTGAKNLAVKPEWLGAGPDLAFLICENQWERLKAYGEAAMDAVRRKIVTPQLEAIIETNVLFSGLGFESAGLGAAHGVYYGLTVLEKYIPPEKLPTHGELVFWGGFVQLISEDAPMSEILEYACWGHKVGLPLTFEEMGFKPGEPTDEMLWKAAEKATLDPGSTIHTEFYMNMGAKEIGPYKNIVDPVEHIFYSMKAADEMGKRIASQVPRVPYEAVWTPYDLGKYMKH
ncbi:MAG: glycerol dehydrogenase [Thaumarchaeota archaeon]|nr:glycerol dehydrogenase [Candidatus Terraquivivens yellowstonensis]